MINLSSLRVSLALTVFVAVAPAAVFTYWADLPWMGFIVGLLALAAAWYGGERFILRQVRVLLGVSRKIQAGDLTSRTQLRSPPGELGELAGAFDAMADALQQRAAEREQTEHTLLNRALQQTVVAALGQFALIHKDNQALFQQAVMLVSQTLELEFCEVLELSVDGAKLLLRAGVGWRDEQPGTTLAEVNGETQAGFALTTGEPVMLSDVRTDKRFKTPPLWQQRGVVSSVCVAIATRHGPFGVLTAHTARKREFTGEEVHFLLGVATALAMATERSRAEAELQKLAAFVQFSPNAALELAEDGTITYCNDAAQQLATAIERPHPRELLPEDVAGIVASSLASGQSMVRHETRIEGRTLSWSFHPVGQSRVVHVHVEDITERLNLEAQLRQSQKMESVGQLAAGVAHDFNNMLTVIQGHAGLLMARPNLQPELFDSAQAVYFASERAANLTRQLLMFSRKNVIQRRVLDLRDVVGHLTKMLKLLLGEPIKLDFHPPAVLPLVHADTGMIEQVIMNLAVNARDAMLSGGTLTLSVNAVEVTEAYVVTRPEARCGNFVCLRVSDTGCGISAATLNRIFEPFFTTKEVGKGTGLGLATVYGIVKQHDGWVEVSSQEGRGSTFSVFLPVSGQEGKDTPRGTDPTAFVRGGSETVLIVEDEPVLREMARVILEECGYHVLDAASGRAALETWDRYSGAIHLLLTDMVMPEGVSGVELADNLLARQPNLKVVFMSGYTVDEVSEAFLAKNNARLLQKPYTRTTLARAVRAALDGRAGPPNESAPVTT